jgi:hypothetical protein
MRIADYLAQVLLGQQYSQFQDLENAWLDIAFGSSLAVNRACKKCAQAGLLVLERWKSRKSTSLATERSQAHEAKDAQGLA